MSAPKWFERKFNPVTDELLPNVLIRLRGTPARIEEMVHGASADALTRKPGESWSAQEHAGHLLDLEPLWLARVEDFATARDGLTAADLTNRKTHEANHNSRRTDEILHAFRNARNRLLARVQELEPLAFRQVLPHPRLRLPMRMVDHLHFVAEHDDHHLVQIWRLLNA